MKIYNIIKNKETGKTYKIPVIPPRKKPRDAYSKYAGSSKKRA